MSTQGHGSAQGCQLSVQGCLRHCALLLLFFAAIQIFSGPLLIGWSTRSKALNSVGSVLQSKLFVNKEKIKVKQLSSDEYFVKVSENLHCFTEGTDFYRTQLHLEKSGSSLATDECQCLAGYHGTDCGIPSVAWNSRFRNATLRRRLTRRTHPRRVVNGFPVLHELTLTQARLEELGDVVEVFLLAESTYSAHGDPKPTYVLDALNKDFLHKYHDQILHVLVDFFPPEAENSSHIADNYLRLWMGKLGIPRIDGLEDDDLFIMNDADEIPKRDLILFLKLYDGFTEPIGLSLRWSIFGFFWKRKKPQNFLASLLNVKSEETVDMFSVATMGLVRDVMQDNVYLIRKGEALNHGDFNTRLTTYQQRHPGLYDPWLAGKAGDYAGWHCSWCLSPRNIQLKLASAQKGDLPRWGDYPEKTNLSYIRSLIQRGRWFDDSAPFFLADPRAPLYAPPFLLARKQRYAGLLYHPHQNYVHFQQPAVSP